MSETVKGLNLAVALQENKEWRAFFELKSQAKIREQNQVGYQFITEGIET